MLLVYLLLKKTLMLIQKAWKDNIRHEQILYVKRPHYQRIF